MKGPYERLKYDLRRHWECPDCKHREHTVGWVTFRICPCQESKKRAEQVCMRLLHEPAPAPPAARTTPEQEAADA